MRVSTVGQYAFIAIALFVVHVWVSSSCSAGPLQAADVSPDFPFGSPKVNMDGRIPTVLIDPSNDSILYAAAEWTGVWKSTDGGQNWEQASRGLRNGLTQEYAASGPRDI
jgi:hypothetical protein